MKNLIAINGSPRLDGNTAQLLQCAVRGATYAGATAEIINLYELNFKGCTSCFACKLKNRPHGVCAMKDDLSPVLDKIKAADAVIFGSPIYFMNLSSSMIAFLERFFFSNYIYSDKKLTVFPKLLPSAYIYTMNMTTERFEQFELGKRLAMNEFTTKVILGVEPKILRAFNTVQFEDYSLYESSIFNPEEKRAYQEKYFPETCAAAFKIGKELIPE